MSPTFTAQWVVSVQFEVAGHTLITYPSHHTLLTLTQLTFDDLTTPSQGVPRDLLGTSRVTVTLYKSIKINQYGVNQFRARKQLHKEQKTDF